MKRNEVSENMHELAYMFCSDGYGKPTHKALYKMCMMAFWVWPFYWLRR